MVRLIRPLRTVLLLAALAVGTARAASPDPEKLLLYNLLDLDQRSLFEPDRHSPLAEMKAWSELYAGLRERAFADASEDRRALKSFLFAGWIARVKGHFATVEAFNTDFMRLFEARPDDTLRVLADEDFMLTDMCGYLAKFFFFENGDPGRRAPWVEKHRPRMESVLGPQRSSLCLEAFWRVKE